MNSVIIIVIIIIIIIIIIYPLQVGLADRGLYQAP
jgi:hypothetical protein